MIVVGLPGVVGVGRAAAEGSASVSTTLTTSASTVASGAGFTVTVTYACASVVSNCTGTYLTVAVPSALNAPSSITTTTHVASTAWNGTTRVMRWNFVEPFAAGSSGQVSFVTSFVHGPTGDGATTSLASTITSTNSGTTTSAAVTLTATAVSSWGAQFGTPIVGALSLDTVYSFRVVDLLAASASNRAFLLGYTMTADFPTGTLFSSASDGGVWSASSTRITWTVSGLSVGSGGASGYVTAAVRYPSGVFASGATVSLTLSGSGVVPAATGTKSVTLTGASYSHRVFAPAISISMSKVSSVAQPAPRTTMFYRISAYNAGNVPTTLQVTDVFPDGLGISPGAGIAIGDTRGLPVAIFYSTAKNPRTSPSWQRLGGSTATYSGTSSGNSVAAPNPLPGGASRITAVRWAFQSALPIMQQFTIDQYLFYSAVSDAGTTVASGTTLTNCATAVATYSSLTSNPSSCVSISGGVVNEQMVSSMVQTGGTPAPGQTTRWTATNTNTGNVPLMFDAVTVFPDGTIIPPGGRIGIGNTAGYAVQISYSTVRGTRNAPVWNVLGTWGGADPVTSAITAPTTLAGGATGITALRYNYIGAIDPGRSFSVANDLRFTNTYDNGNPVPTGATLSKCINTSYGFTALIKTVSACASVVVPTPYLALQNSNWVSDGTGTVPGSYPTVALGGTVTFPLVVTNTTNSWFAAVDPVITEVVSSFALPSGASWSASASLAVPAGLTYSSATGFSATPLSGGRTALRFQLSGSLAVGTSAQMNLTIKVGQSLAGQDITQTMWVAATTPTTPISCNSPAVTTGAGAATDTENVLGLGATTTACRAVWGHRSAAVAAVESGLWVKGAYDTGYSKYPNKGQTVAGGQADYRLSISNAGTVQLKNIVVVDLLPAVGDTAVVTTKARGSQYSPSLAGAVETSNPAIKVWYSTAKNPCRPEVGVTTKCVAPNWMSVVPTNPTVVRSIKLDFTSIVLSPAEQIQFDWPMRAPSGTPVNSVAWNSIGYRVTRADNNSVLLPSEPMMTGLSVLPPQPNFIGDRVWSDGNANGIQDLKEGGINGIKVRLYSGVDSSLVATTITGNNYAGKPGYYLFANLPDGSYYVVFDVSTVPSGGVVVPQGQGSDPTLDSDADPVTGRTATFTVAGLTGDFTRDMGIYLPQCDTITC